MLAGGLFAAQARRPSVYTAEVGLVITEGVLSADGSPRPHGELRVLIDDAIFVRARLEELIDKRDLVRKLGVSGKVEALVDVKRRIEVEVWQDYFELSRQSADPPRSAHVNIAFSARDPETALAVAHDLGELLATSQIAREVDAVAARIASLRAIADSAVARANRERDRAEKARVAAVGRPVDPMVLRGGEPNSTTMADEAARVAEARLFEAQIQMREIRQASRLVQVIDSGDPLWRSIPRRARLLRQAEISLVCAVFLAVVLVGALDPTVRDPQDLRRVGLPLIGSVPVCSPTSPSAKV
jgi:capsular polysaccharide biosynthesis protein